MTVGRGMRPPRGGIGRRLRARRIALGISQRELQEPGVSYAYISRIERGQRDPSVKALRRLSAKLGVSAHWLETGEPEPSDVLAGAVRLLIERGQIGTDATTAEDLWQAALAEAREQLAVEA